MSWLQDLAGKAETMLNKLDQNAATVLHQTSEVVSSITTNSNIEKVPLMDVKVENEVSKMPRPTSKGSMMQLTPKKNVTIGAQLSGSLSNTGQDLQSIGIDIDKRSNNSSRRSSMTHEGTVIEKVTEASMQTSFDGRNDSCVQLRLVELEEICNSLVSEKEFLIERNQNLEEANAKNIKTISELELTIAKHLKNEVDLREKLEWAKKETNQAIAELQQYRTRAQQTLQMKEKLIEELKLGHSEEAGNVYDSDLENGTNALRIELENIKSENRSLLEEISMLNDKCEQTKNYAVRLERMLESGAERERKLNEVQESFNNIVNKCSQLEEELKARVQETILLKEEMMKQRGQFKIKMSEKEIEIFQLRDKMSQRVQSSSNEAEERIHSLTHSLVQKQTALESITAERNALRIQLEKLDVS